MTKEEFENFVNSYPWRFAKTMPKCPHFYVVRNECWDDEEFASAVVFIREHGDARKWGKYNHIYYDYAGHRYWTMGAPVEKTLVINRADNLSEPL